MSTEILVPDCMQRGLKRRGWLYEDSCILKGLYDDLDDNSAQSHAHSTVPSSSGKHSVTGMCRKPCHICKWGLFLDVPLTYDHPVHVA